MDCGGVNVNLIETKPTPYNILSADNQMMTEGLLKYISPQDIIDPFGANGELFGLYPDKTWLVSPEEKYQKIYEDMINNPVDYTDKWVVSRPYDLPIDTSNWKEKKKLFEKVKMNNTYEYFIRSIIGCNGGILIVPVNFFSSWRPGAQEVTKLFLSNYKICRVNFFQFLISRYDRRPGRFCAFSFYKKKNTSQKVPFYVWRKKGEEPQYREILLEEQYDYRILGKELNDIFSSTRYFWDNHVQAHIGLNPTYIRCRYMDKPQKQQRMSFEMRGNMIPEETIRRLIDLYTPETITPKQQEIIVAKSQAFLEKMRDDCADTLFTTKTDDAFVSSPLFMELICSMFWEQIKT